MNTTRRGFIASMVAGSAMMGVPAKIGRGGKTLEVPSGNIPVAGEYDLVVAGGSTTGVAAAVVAARAGLSVAIVESNAFFGGNVDVTGLLVGCDIARAIRQDALANNSVAGAAG